MGWPEESEAHQVAGSPTGLGWPAADDVPSGPVPSSATPATPAGPAAVDATDVTRPAADPAAEDEPAPTRGRRRRGRVVAPAGPPRKSEDEASG